MPDDDKTGPEPDPWDEIVADGLGDDFGIGSPSPDDGLTDPPVDVSALTGGDDDGGPLPDVAAGPPDTEAGSIEDWLTDDDGGGAAESPVLSVFAPEDPAAGLSDVDIGTGASGIALHGEADPDAAAGDSADDGTDVGDWADVEAVAADGAAVGEPQDDAAEDAAAATVALDESPRAETPARRSGIGRWLGIALGALAAVPVALGILLFGLGQDPLGIAGLVPRQAAFLLPSGVRPAAPAPVTVATPQPVAPPGDAAAPVTDEAAPITDEAAPADTDASPAPAADAAADVAVASADAAPAPVGEPDVPPTADGMAVEDPAPVASVEPPEESTSDSVTDPAADPAMDPSADSTVDAAMDSTNDGLADEPAVAAVEPEPPTEPAVGPGSQPAASPEPPLDALAAVAPPLDPVDPVDPVPPGDEPAPAPVVADAAALDTAVLDEAVAEAAALGEALGVVDDRGTRAYRLLRTRWYRALARVAEELVALDHAAAAAGRPLDAPPDNVALLRDAIGGRDVLAAELAALAPDWLAYAKRGSDGVVLAVTFESTRRTGPYWTTRATFDAADGRPRNVTVVSRTEPQAIVGDRLLVTGVALDAAVIWAADVRGIVAGAP